MRGAWWKRSRNWAVSCARHKLMYISEFRMRSRYITKVIPGEQIYGRPEGGCG